MGLRNYHPARYYEEHGDCIHAALEDLWTLRHTAENLDEPALDRLDYSGWSWTSQYSMETDPFCVMEHQLTSVLYATGYDLQADMYYSHYEELEATEDVLDGARDARNRKAEDDPVLVCDGWHEGLLIAAAHGQSQDVHRLAYDLARLEEHRERTTREVKAYAKKIGSPAPSCRPFPRIYIRPPRSPEEMARINRHCRDGVKNRALIFIILPTEMGFYNDEAITKIYEGLLENWESKRDRDEKRAKEARANRERARARAGQRARKRRHKERRARRLTRGRERLAGTTRVDRLLHPPIRGSLRPNNR